MSPIRHIAPAAEGQFVALGEYEREVSIWALDPPRRVSTFTTILDPGGRRLALDRDGQRCFAAAFHVEGIACYETETGGTRWSRRDLKRAQKLRASIDGRGLYAFFDQGPGQLLDAANGHTIGRFRGARDIFESPFSPIDLFSMAKLELRLRNGGRLASLERSTFALLSAAFSPSCVVTSESTGPVRWFDLEKGQEVWRYVPKSGSHVLEVGYCHSSGDFFGVDWPYEHGGPKTLLRFDLESRSASVAALIGSPAEASFWARGEFLLTSDGNLFTLPTVSSMRIEL